MAAEVKQFEIKKVNGQYTETLQDSISIEEPLEIRLAFGEEGKELPVSVTMRTPGDDEELAIGFLFTEKTINQPTQILAISKSATNVISVELKADVEIKLESLSRNFYTTSSCGVCGKASIDAIHIGAPSVQSTIKVKASVIKNLPAILLQKQREFQATGGIHASALFEVDGSFMALREDVGRHNALDKLIGSMFLNSKLPLSESILLVSGRASFELIQKAVRAGIPIVAAIGAPSSLAIELAEEKGITLIGFLKNTKFNIYSHANRIIND